MRLRSNLVGATIRINDARRPNIRLKPILTDGQCPPIRCINIVFCDKLVFEGVYLRSTQPCRDAGTYNGLCERSAPNNNVSASRSNLTKNLHEKFFAELFYQKAPRSTTSKHKLFATLTYDLTKLFLCVKIFLENTLDGDYGSY